MTEHNEGLDVLKGALLVLALHFAAGAVILALGFMLEGILGGYRGLMVLLVGAGGFLFWQLLYVIPLIMRLQRQGKQGMVKGAIAMAVLTALLNGSCFLYIMSGA
ncbi:MAG: hypothetical protein WA902_06545 [Thermosynechococcaceae cyanobacterium]